MAVEGTAGLLLFRPFRTIESVAYVTWVLRHCNHNGFPVVRGAPGDSEDDRSDNIGLSQEEGTSSREGPLEGVILRSQLMVLLINKLAPLYTLISPGQA